MERLIDEILEQACAASCTTSSASVGRSPRRLALSFPRTAPGAAAGPVSPACPFFESFWLQEQGRHGVVNACGGPAPAVVWRCSPENVPRNTRGCFCVSAHVRVCMRMQGPELGRQGLERAGLRCCRGGSPDSQSADGSDDPMVRQRAGRPRRPPRLPRHR
jgi:hypothetical protein